MALPPVKLSDFRISGQLGSGATARVYDAFHVVTGAEVAIKMLDPSSDLREMAAGAEMRERFAREALLLGNVVSRHVGAITGFGFEKGRPFLVLERLRGETLDAKLRRDGPVPITMALSLIEQLLVGVRDCHDAKIIHRDIKPSNIFVHEDGPDFVVKLIDFGVARLREITNEVGALTNKNQLIGSMGYMAPEQFSDAGHVTYAADLYAVGVVVFRTFTGRLPFVSRSLDAVIRMKSENQVPLVSAMPNMPKSNMLDWFVAKAMAATVEERFVSAREMLEHWSNVIASLETTDVIGRVDESYAGMVPRPSEDDERTLIKPPSAQLINEGAPPTLASPGIADVFGDEDDLVTKNNPNLRTLVERELALSRGKKQSG